VVVEDNRLGLVALLSQVCQKLLGGHDTHFAIAQPGSIAVEDVPVAGNGFGVPVAFGELLMIHFKGVSHGYSIMDSWQVIVNQPGDRQGKFLDKFLVKN